MNLCIAITFLTPFHLQYGLVTDDSYLTKSELYDNINIFITNSESEKKQKTNKLIIFNINIGPVESYPISDLYNYILFQKGQQFGPLCSISFKKLIFMNC